MRLSFEAAFILVFSLRQVTSVVFPKIVDRPSVLKTSASMSRGAAAKNRCATGRAIFVNSGGFVGKLEPTFLPEFVIAALIDSAFEELLLLAGGDFFN